MKIFNRKKRCQCCNRKFKAKKLTVHSSVLGPASSIYCDECNTQMAEPEWLVKYYIDGKAKLSDWVWDVKVYKKGKYCKLSDYIVKFL